MLTSRFESDKKECQQPNYLQHIYVNNFLHHGSICILDYDVIPRFQPPVNSFLNHSVYRPLFTWTIKNCCFLDKSAVL